MKISNNETMLCCIDIKRSRMDELDTLALSRLQRSTPHKMLAAVKSPKLVKKEGALCENDDKLAANSIFSNVVGDASIGTS